MEWMILPLKRYAQFQGRSRRMEYWMFILFSFVVSVVLSLLDSALGLGGHATSYTTQAPGNYAAGAHTSGGLLSGIWSLAVLVPTIAVGVRRLHDIDRTGWWLVAPIGLGFLGGIAMIAGSPALGGLLFIPAGLVAIVLLVFACLDGTRGPNRFGPDPKGNLGDLQGTFR